MAVCRPYELELNTLQMRDFRAGISNSFLIVQPTLTLSGPDK